MNNYLLKILSSNTFKGYQPAQVLPLAIPMSMFFFDPAFSTKPTVIPESERRQPQNRAYTNANYVPAARHFRNAL
jgi:hypothetical protein